MKTTKVTIEIQQICLKAIKLIFNAMEIFLQRIETENYLCEEPTLILEPYNTGYIIKIDYLAWNYRNKEVEKYMKFRTHIYLQPCTFFEEYLKDDTAHLEYSLLTPNKNGYTSGRTDVGGMDDLKTIARKWAEGLITEINNS